MNRILVSCCFVCLGGVFWLFCGGGGGGGGECVLGFFFVEE